MHDHLDSMTPEELAAQAQRGSIVAYTRLVAVFEVRLFNFLLRRIGNRQDAEDLTQEAFLRAWERIGSYRSAWRFSTWLYTIAARLAISHARRADPRVPLGEDDGIIAGDIPEPAEDRGWIWRLVDDVLTPEQRTAVWLRYVEDLAIGDIATVMNKSQVGVRVMLYRARAALAEHLRPETVDAPGEDAAPEVRTRVARPVAGGIR